MSCEKNFCYSLLFKAEWLIVQYEMFAIKKSSNLGNKDASSFLFSSKTCINSALRSSIFWRRVRVLMLF